MDTEKTQRKKTMKKISIWKYNTSFSNFFRNMTFTNLATFQNFVIMTLSTLRPRATHCVRFSKRRLWSYQLFSYFQLFLEPGSKLVQFSTKFKVKQVLFLRQNELVCGSWYCAANHQYGKIFDFIENIKDECGY